MSALERKAFPYCAYYCEENIWQLAKAAGLPPGARHVLLVTNAGRKALLFQQRAGDNGMVVWDYHVVLVVEEAQGPAVYDLDSLLPFPTPLALYAAQTFGMQALVPGDLRPHFRLLPAEAYLERFASDRSHMRGPDGEFLQPPPPWPLLDRGDWTLKNALDLNLAAPGELLDLDGLLARFGAKGA